MPDGPLAHVTAPRGSALETSEKKRHEALGRIERAKMYQAKNDLDGAQAEVTNAWYALDEALAICPQNHRARFLLVSCSMNAEDFQRAKAEAMTIYKDLSREQLVHMNDSVLHLSIAHAAKMCDEPDEAMRFAKEASELYPKDPQPYMVLGELLHELGRVKDAEQKCRAALKYNDSPDCQHPLNPQNAYFTYCCLASCLVHQQRYADAELFVQRALAIDSEQEMGWQHLIDIYQAQGRLHEAIQIAQRLVERDPDDTDAVAALEHLENLAAEGGSDRGTKPLGRKDAQRVAAGAEALGPARYHTPPPARPESGSNSMSSQPLPRASQSTPVAPRKSSRDASSVIPYGDDGIIQPAPVIPKPPHEKDKDKPEPDCMNGWRLCCAFD